MKIKCETCKEKYKVTFKKNIKIEDDIKFVTLESRDKRSFLFLNHENRNISEKIIKYNATCPNCGNNKHLFSISTGVKVEGEWYDYSD